MVHHFTAAIIAIVLVQSRVTAQEQPHRKPTVAVILAAIGGSFAGVAGGSWLGERVSEQFNIDRGGDDPGQAARLIGAGVGSVVGTALAAEFGSRLTDNQPVGFGQRMRDAGVGLFVGLAVGRLAASLAEPHAGRGWRIGYSSGQGFYAGASNGRW